MSSMEREASADRNQMVRHHQHSFSEAQRLHIPMWDSSDPERAPPPLPLNPNPNSPIIRPNTSANIAAAARALEEKARENAPASNYTTNPMPSRSPERSLIKGAAHKRMQSLQSPSVKDMRSYLDGSRTPDRSPDRLASRVGTPLYNRDGVDYLSSPVEKSPSRTETPTPSARDMLRDTPSLRPSARPTHRSILGENTPPTSSTMLALQNMAIKDFDDTPRSGTTASATSKSRQEDDVASRVAELTEIARKLQDDMAQLSRRSKDNATDLMSLKDATHSRDEDIRKSLKELVTTMNNGNSPFVGVSKSLSKPGSTLKPEPKDPNVTPTLHKSFSMPRMPSPSVFFEDSIGSPNPYSIEGAASVAMLEKIIREMVTKDGQERLLNNLSQLLEKASEDSGETTKKVSELVAFIKAGPQSQALVRHQSTNSDNSELASIARSNFQMPHLAQFSKPYQSPKAADFVSDEMLKLLRKIKDSVGESGSETSEVKKLVGDLRTEVLGMGRELGRRVDTPREGDHASPKAEELVQIVQDGLDELREQMHSLIREKRRQSSSTVLSKSSVNNQEVYEVVKEALNERGLIHAQPAAGLDKEAILDAVKEAYEAYKPEIELTQFGLERDEILQCLKEGMEEYRNSNQIVATSSTTREEVMDAVHDALQHFNPPTPMTEAQEVREEMLSAFRECLDEFKPAITSRELEGTRELEINREDLFDAVKAGLATSGHKIPEDIGAEVLERLHEILQTMQRQFQEYSTANGKDSDQVLTTLEDDTTKILQAMKDGMVELRTEIQQYVDRAQDVTGKDEIIDTVRHAFDELRLDVEGLIKEGTNKDEEPLSKADMLAYIKSEFEHLHEVIGTRGSRELKDGLDSDVNSIVKEELERLSETIAQGNVTAKEEILESLKDGFGSNGQAASNDELLLLVKDEFTHLRETLATTLIKTGASSDKEEIIEAVRELIDNMQGAVQVRDLDASPAGLTEVMDEIKALRANIDSAVAAPTSSSSDKDEIMEALRSGLEEINLPNGTSDETINALRSELDALRQLIAQGVTVRSTGADTEEVLDAVRLGLDDLRSHLEKKIENPERQMSATGEILDALSDGLDSLRADVIKVVDKPVDMTVSYEILDTLKEGLANLQEEVKQLKSGSSSTRGLDETVEEANNQVVLAEDPAAVSREVSDTPSVDALGRQDFGKVEVALTQLQIKVEAMDANIHTAPSAASEPVSASIPKEELATIEETLKDIQAVVTVMAAKDAENKEDTEAIETLLRNTKDKLDDLTFPDLSTLASKEQLETIEAGLKVVNEAVDGLASKTDENAATKADVAVVEVLIADMKTAFDELKELSTSKEGEPITKTDLDVLGVLCTEMKDKLEEMKIPDEENLPTKAELELIKGLLNDFRDSHNELRESYETDLKVTCGIQEERKKEAEDIAERVNTVKTALDEFREELQAKLEEGLGVEGIKENVKSLEETISANFGISADVKELIETVTREFERVQGAADGLKLDNEEKLATTIGKHDEIRDAIIEDISKKLDERFETMTTKFDDAQILAEANVKTMEEKIASQETLLTDSKTASEELKVTIDTLGTALTTMQTSFAETTEKMTQDSQTVFEKMGDTHTKLDDHHADAKTEHQETRNKVVSALDAINNLQGEVTEYHPKFMVALKEILALVNQHYEHSQKAQEEAQEKLREVTEATRSGNDEIKNSFVSLPALLPPPPAEPTPVEKYDDTEVRAKLREILESTTTDKSAAQIERLDQIHAQVMATANEVTNFVATQTKLVIEGHENKEREAEEVALLLERRLVQKEQVKSDISGLNDEKEVLRAEVEALKMERESLSAQKLKLNADVAAFQTALNIRREELTAMDAKADALERRILEGIMDHSRAMLIAKAGRPAPRPRQVHRNISTATESTLGGLSPSNAATNGLSMALSSKPRPAIRRNGGQQPNPSARRILSLSQITGNAQPPQPFTTPAPSVGFNNLKRSHSVKTHGVRKGSWAANNKRSVSIHDKENDVLPEDAEGEARALVLSTHNEEYADLASPIDGDDLMSEAGTERRHSYRPRDSDVSHDSSYVTGSSDASTMRSVSYGSTVERSQVNGEEMIDEEEEPSGDEKVHSDEERDDDVDSLVSATDGAPSVRGQVDEEPDTTMGAQESPDISRSNTTSTNQTSSTAAAEVSVNEAKDTVAELRPFATLKGQDSPKMSRRFTYDSDSGLGTDLPTADLTAGESEAEYFRRRAEEGSEVGGK